MLRVPVDPAVEFAMSLALGASSCSSMAFVSDYRRNRLSAMAKQLKIYHLFYLVPVSTSRGASDVASGYATDVLFDRQPGKKRCTSGEHSIAAGCSACNMPSSSCFACSSTLRAACLRDAMVAHRSHEDAYDGSYAQVPLELLHWTQLVPLRHRDSLKLSDIDHSVVWSGTYCSVMQAYSAVASSAGTRPGRILARGFMRSCM